MKRLLLALLALVAAVSALPAAQSVKTVNGLAIASVKTVNGLAIASVKSIGGLDNTASSEFTGGTLLHTETFEATEYDLTWVEAGTGTQNGDYTTNILEGAESLNVAGASAVAYSYFAGTAADTVSIDMLLRINSKGSGTVTVMKCTNSGTNLGIITLAGTSTPFTLGCQANAGTANTCSVDVASGTLIYLRVQYTKGTGANAVIGVGYSLTSFASIPNPLTASGTNSAVSSNGTRTTQLNRFLVGNDSSATFDIVVDHFKWYSVP